MLSKVSCCFPIFSDKLPSQYKEGATNLRGQYEREKAALEATFARQLGSDLLWYASTVVAAILSSDIAILLNICHRHHN